ncbi:MAG TPA: RCC1 repeat-containing protein, partial [Candidatus Poseidoniales archaeon]|nr:RCC1 repeat-containing protein [Candidatus Poseidoniales archaeon]
MKRYSLLILTLLMLAPLLPFAEPTNELKEIDEPRFSNALGSIILSDNAWADAISSGWRHTCAILDKGTVFCWGNRGTFDTHTPTPTSSLGTGRTAVAISSGGFHTCAILDNGAVSCWGYNGYGQLGDGTYTDRNTPTLTSSLGTNRTAVAISARGEHTCALLDNGAVSCWGRNDFGQLGNGVTAHKNTPTLTSSLGTGRTAVAISSGGSHTCAILDNGAVSCWGQNNRGQLGNGGNSDKNSPTLTSSLGTNRTAVAISLGTWHTCVIL